MEHFVASMEPGYFDKKLARRIDTLNNEHDRIIVNGMRTFTNIEAARSNYPDARHSIIWMDADFDKLYERYSCAKAKI